MYGIGYEMPDGPELTPRVIIVDQQDLSTYVRLEEKPIRKPHALNTGRMVDAWEPGPDAKAICALLNGEGDNVAREMMDTLEAAIVMVAFQIAEITTVLRDGVEGLSGAEEAEIPERLRALGDKMLVIAGGEAAHGAIQRLQQDRPAGGGL